jgi:hypothetical protein
MDRMLFFVRPVQLIFIALTVFFSSHAVGQIEGCMDPQALNYNGEATWNDGSCYYEETYFIPDHYTYLPATLSETSGLIYCLGGIWTFNDSGGDAKIYKLDTISGDIIQIITISNGENVDWEDIAQDEDHIYVGDFGNNSGSRKDLVIYKVSKSDIPATGNAAIIAEIIAYSYADQNDFTPHSNDNEYDCEAIICVEGNIYLFTKNWVSETTRLYTLPAEPGNHSILPVDSLDVSGLITGAAYSDELDQVVLSGYRNYAPFLYLLFDYHENSFFSGNKRNIQMPGIFGAQTEGVCFKEGSTAFLSCEESLFNQQLFTFSTAIWTDTTLLSIPESLNTIEVRVHPNPLDNSDLSIDIHNPDRAFYQVNIYDLKGKKVYSKKHNAPEGETNYSFRVRIPEVSPGMYLLHILSGDLFAREKIIVR